MGLKSCWEAKQEKHEELANGFGEERIDDLVKSSFCGVAGIKSLPSPEVKKQRQLAWNYLEKNWCDKKTKGAAPLLFSC